MRPSKQRAVIDWLTKQLSNGPRTRQNLIADAKASGIGMRSLERAKDTAGFITFFENKVWYWKDSSVSLDRPGDTVIEVLKQIQLDLKQGNKSTYDAPTISQTKEPKSVIDDWNWPDEVYKPLNYEQLVKRFDELNIDLMQAEQVHGKKRFIRGGFETPDNTEDITKITKEIERVKVYVRELFSK